MRPSVGGERFEGRLAWRRTSVWARALALVAGLGPLGWIVATGLGWEKASPILLVPAFFLYLRRLPLLDRWTKPIASFEDVRIDRDAIHLGTRTVPRPSVRDARLVPVREGGLVVRVSRRGRLPLDLGVRDREEGHRVLRALGFDASQVVGSFRGPSWVAGAKASGFAIAIGSMAALSALGLKLLLSPPASPQTFAAAAFLFLLGFVPSAIPSRIEVGADGIVLRWLAARKFLPLAKMRRAEASSVETAEQVLGGEGVVPVKVKSVGVRITMTDDTVAWLPLGDGRAEELAGTLAERIRSAIETRARSGNVAAAALLGRRARDVRDWIRDLRATGAGADATLRTAPMNGEQLWRIVESHDATSEDRAAAAVALQASLDDRGRERLRLAVAAVTDTRLRVAIDAAAEGDDETLARALDEVSGGRARARERAP